MSPIPFRLSLTFFVKVCVSVVFAAVIGYSQTRIYVKPSRPLFPKNTEECSELNRKWNEIRQEISRQHSACLDNHKNCSREERGTCSCSACQHLHDSSNLGQDDVNACYEDVRAYQREERKRQEEERQRKEDDQRRQEETERENRRLRQQQQEQGQREKNERDERDKRREQAQREEEQRRKEKADSDRKAISAAMDESKKEQEALAQRTAMRERLREGLDTKRQTAENNFSKELATLASEKQSMLDKIAALAQKTVTTELFNSDNAKSTGGSEFDLSGLRNAESPSRTGNDWIDRWTSVAQTLVPFASIPAAFVGNAVKESIQAMDGLSYAIENFERLESSYPEAILTNYKEKVFGPATFVRIMAEESVGNIVVGRLESAVHKEIEPIVTGVTNRFNRSVEKMDWTELTRKGSPPIEPRPVVRHWWTYGPAKEARVRVDKNNVPILYDQTGSVYRPASGSGQLSRNDVERLVATEDLRVRIDRPSEWKENVQILFAPKATPVEGFTVREEQVDWISEFAAGQIVESAWEQIYTKGNGIPPSVEKFFGEATQKTKAYQQPSKSQKETK